ncbi:MAG: hypothetical protein LBJ00_04295 [Planctomycetaceae bacterium]|jgi:hypothetical protein|nr:hypothetical protein [Planctomycetaceae bacterium]
MSNFKDSSGRDWTIKIKTESADLVKKYCHDQQGKPIDLFRAIELNQIEQILFDVELLVNIVFVLLRDQVYEVFDVDEYNCKQADLYEDFPELKNEPKMGKASRWFGGCVDGDVLRQMLVAFEEAIIDFFPSESKRETIRKALNKIREIEKQHTTMVLEQIDLNAEKMIPIMREQIAQSMKPELFAD